MRHYTHYLVLSLMETQVSVLIHSALFDHVGSQIEDVYKFGKLRPGHLIVFSILVGTSFMINILCCRSEGRYMDVWATLF